LLPALHVVQVPAFVPLQVMEELLAHLLANVVEAALQVMMLWSALLV